MENELNPWEQTCHDQCLKVRGHDVAIVSPTNIKITVHCPWNAPRIGERPTQHQQTWFMTQTQAVVNYLVNEQFIENESGGLVNVQVNSEFQNS
jgi:hypothetical protein